MTRLSSRFTRFQSLSFLDSMLDSTADAITGIPMDVGCLLAFAYIIRLPCRTFLQLCQPISACSQCHGLRRTTLFYDAVNSWIGSEIQTMFLPLLDQGSVYRPLEWLHMAPMSNHMAREEAIYVLFYPVAFAPSYRQSSTPWPYRCTRCPATI